MPTTRAAAATVAVIVLGCELLDRRVRRADGPVRAEERGGVVVVLGFPGRNAAMRGVQRWRVQMGVQALALHDCSRVIFSGGAPGGGPSEASQMAADGQRLGLIADQIVLEERSTSTWENVAGAAALVGDAPLVVLVSDGLHAERARGYWHEQFPHTAERVIVDPTYRFLDHVWLKVPSILFQVVRSAARRVKSLR